MHKLRPCIQLLDYLADLALDPNQRRGGLLVSSLPLILLLVVHNVNNHHNLPNNLYYYNHHYSHQHQSFNLPQAHLADILILREAPLKKFFFF